MVEVVAGVLSWVLLVSAVACAGWALGLELRARRRGVVVSRAMVGLVDEVVSSALTLEGVAQVLPPGGVAHDSEAGRELLSANAELYVHLRVLCMAWVKAGYGEAGGRRGHVGVADDVGCRCGAAVSVFSAGLFAGAGSGGGVGFGAGWWGGRVWLG